MVAKNYKSSQGLDQYGYSNNLKLELLKIFNPMISFIYEQFAYSFRILVMLSLFLLFYVCYGTRRKVKRSPKVTPEPHI